MAERLAQLVAEMVLTEDQAFDVGVMWAHQEEDRCDCAVCVGSKRLLRRLNLKEMI